MLEDVMTGTVDKVLIWGTVMALLGMVYDFIKKWLE